MFIPSQEYRRSDLHAKYKGQDQGGISTPADFPIILAFSSKRGEQYGYYDGWQDSGVFYYTGEGQKDDMQMVRGNRAIAEHTQNGKDLHLFLAAERRLHVKYEGQFVCTGHHSRRSMDIDGQERSAIIFELSPVDVFLRDEDPEAPPLLQDDDLDRLRELALADSADARFAKARVTLARYRSADVRRYVLRRANGMCEGCGQLAAFKTMSGLPYLEAHHIRRLSDGGPDDPRWVAGLCANCHRRAHYSVDRVEFNRVLGKRVHLLEPVQAVRR